MNRDDVIRMARESGIPEFEEIFMANSDDLGRFASHVAEECAKVCDAYPSRDPAEDGNGYWAANECSSAIRSLYKPTA